MWLNYRTFFFFFKSKSYSFMKHSIGTKTYEVLHYYVLIFASVIYGVLPSWPSTVLSLRDDFYEVVMIKIIFNNKRKNRHKQ